MAYTTPELIASSLRADTSFSSTTIPSLDDVNVWINEIDSYIDNLANRKFAVSGYEELYHYDREAFLFVRYTPLVSVTTLEYNTSSNGSAPVWVTLTENTDYIVDLRKGMIVLLTSTYNYGCGYNKFRVNYVSGYTTLPMNVQMLATKLVTQRVLDTLISKNVNERNDGGSISVGDISIVEPSNYGVGSYRQLGADIGKLEESIVGGFRVLRYG
jgi:hypothetical protein